MRVRNHLWSLAGALVIEGIISFLGDMSLREFSLLALGSVGALAINLGGWDE